MVSIRQIATAFVAAGLALIGAGIALQGTAARAASPRDREAPPVQYTAHAPGQASQAKLVPLMIDRDFDQVERQRIVAAVRQWNYVLNGYVRFEAKLLPDDATREELARVRRNGGWVVAKVDSHHSIAQKGEGTNALAVTVTGGRNGGFVYVIADRIGGRDLTGVIMHEFGHVLGAGHDDSGLMAPVYSASGGRCIDYMAASLVAEAQRLPVKDLNWCETPRRDQRYQPRTARGDWR